MENIILFSIVGFMSLTLIGGLIFSSFKWGKRDNQADIAEEEVDVIKRQRDNDITTVDDADSVWDKWKK